MPVPAKIVLAALLGAVYLSSSPMWIDRLIFHPYDAIPAPPAGVEERWFETDGLRLHAWYAHAADGAPTLVWSHGNGGNIADRAGVLGALRARGLNVLAYDYRGYGRSQGSPSEDGVYRDVLAAYDGEIARGVPDSRIVCFGESLGGAVSIYLASQRRCAGVVVVSTFTTLRAVARSHFGPLGLLAGGRFDSLRRVATLSAPLFVAHGERDEVVPFALGEELYGAAPEPKRFLAIASARHNDIFESALLLDEIAAFAHAATRLAAPR